MNKNKKIVSSVMLASVLSACGSGGGDGADNQLNSPSNTNPETNTTAPPLALAKISGSINSVNNSEKVLISASGNGELHTARLDSQGQFSFENLDANTTYSLKVHAPGQRQSLSISTKPSNESLSLELETQPTPELDGIFKFVWQDDGESVSGLEYASVVNQPVQVVVEGQEKAIPNIGAAQMLYRDYNIVLDDGGDLPWSQAFAYRLLETMRQIPQAHCSDNEQTLLGLRCKPTENNVAATSWQLSNSQVLNDISVSAQQVTISTASFSYSEPQIVSIDNQRGRFYSKRLHHSAVAFVTNFGANLSRANYILAHRFGVSIDTRGSSANSNFNSLYNSLPVTGSADRQASAWQSFTPEEVLIVINQFEELPQGLHIIRDKNNDQRGLKYLLRRANGHDHPLYPDAPAVAWPSAGYIEFMEKAFKGDNLEHMQRLVLHEKSHFLWHYVLNTDMKLEWASLSGWYRVDGNESSALNEESYSTSGNGSGHTHGTAFSSEVTAANVDSSAGWSATKTTNFVSGYAQLKNPNEDLAESVSYFLANPDKLRSRAPAKYDFIRERLMAGVMYLSQIRPDLSFEVLNLFPDYVYPGKIKGVDIQVNGMPDDDKQVVIELQLHTSSSACTSSRCLEGASLAFTRLFSDGDTFKDIYFYPVNANGSRVSISDRLRASFTMPNTAKNGWWAPAQITVTDPLGNERYQRSTDYGWQLYLNNPMEDTVAPEYVANSLTVELSEVINAEVVNGRWNRSLANCSETAQECRQIRTITARWDVDEDMAMRDPNGCFARFAQQQFDVYSMDAYGDYDINVQGIVDGQCQAQVIATEYFRSGDYHVAMLSLQDRALNQSRTLFSFNNSQREASPTVFVDNSSADADTQKPVMNQQVCSGIANEECLSVSASPSNPANPNGETNVEISYWARDDKSGLGTVSYRLRDPQGVEHFYYHQHDNTHTLFFNGDATQWRQYTARVTLPVGSAPGTWGLASMSLHDKAGNRQFYDFSETLIFEPFEVE